ncbi:MAG: NUDIX hydrolase [Cyanobacteria bacterium SID2]|nr:NUDIX hydrolase [Cyanobacteria bacterium SID2]MBP0003094.1 NUDIX hydrolase [Cyanobacteria bacterium SBC]
MIVGRAWQYVKTVLGVIFRHPISGATLIPILPNGEIVLILRRDTKEWGLPGGIIDWGEDIPSAAKRELREETGLDLVKLRRLVGVYSHPDRDPRIHSISILLEVDAEGLMSVGDTYEILDVRSFSIDELPLDNLCHDHERQIQDYLNGATVIA